MLKKTIMWLAVIFVVFYLVTEPTSAGHLITSAFHGLGCALMLGASRKSFIGHLSGGGPSDRLPGSLAAALIGAAQGVALLRVHDVAATRQALAVWLGREARALS